jgi:segregation and condensation protein B
MSLTAIIESILFSSEASMTLDRLCDLLAEYEREDIKAGLKELVLIHEERAGGFVLAEVAGGWQFRTRPELQQYVARQARTRAVNSCLPPADNQG